MYRIPMCFGDSHMWRFDGSYSNDEPAPDLRCDCGEFLWVEMQAAQPARSVQREDWRLSEITAALRELELK